VSRPRRRRSQPRRMGVVRPVSQTHELARVQPRRAYSEADGVDGRGDRGHDGVTRVSQWSVVPRVLFVVDTHSRTHAIGGLLVDFGVLTLRSGVLSPEHFQDGSAIPRLEPSHPAVVEWRAMTVIELFVPPFLSPDACSSRSQRSHRRWPQTQIQPRPHTTHARPSPRERHVERRTRDRAKEASRDGRSAHRHCQ